MTGPSLLVELLVEELPPKALPQLGAAFGSLLHERLAALGLCQQNAAAVTFATPRRLAVRIPDVRPRAADQPVRQKLVPVAIGLDAHGQPTAVLQKKLAALGAPADAVARLVRASDGKAETLFLDTVVPGVTLAAGLQQALDAMLAALPIPKVMTYQAADGWSPLRFVRPAHGLVALHGSEVVPVQLLGLAAGRTTRGHRFESRTPQLELAHADEYETRLERDGAVLASFAGRRAAIAAQLQQHATAAGLQPIDDPALLDEVTALVERPHVLACRFDTEFLAVPQECLILTMKQNQKYFPLLDRNGVLSNQFLVVANVRPADPSAVIGGNERVVRPRLADARFFYTQDQKQPLAARLPSLDKVVYHQKLGSQGERVARLRSIAAAIGERLGGAALASTAARAAELAKADLLTEMVGEFPELQGIMGGYYARHDGEPPAVAAAIEDHYRPRFQGDTLPREPAGLCVALADKLDTLVGLFGIGQLPTGDKDPFALRRHALGVVRMLLERDLPLRLDELLALAVPAFGARITDPTAALLDFVFERLAFLLREQGHPGREVDAVLALRPMRLGEVPRRLAAVRAFGALPEAEALAAANKRIGNILKKSAAAPGAAVDAGLLREPAEQALFAALGTVQAAAGAKLAGGDYTGALVACAQLRSPVDAFFDAVMVNAEDPAVRSNRHALLAALQGLMNQVAELARLAG